jgi:DNA-binding CsgD family transcriptional regulator
MVNGPVSNEARRIGDRVAMPIQRAHESPASRSRQPAAHPASRRRPAARSWIRAAEAPSVTPVALPAGEVLLLPEQTGTLDPGVLDGVARMARDLLDARRVCLRPVPAAGTDGAVLLGCTSCGFGPRLLAEGSGPWRLQGCVRRWAGADAFGTRDARALRALLDVVSLVAARASTPRRRPRAGSPLPSSATSPSGTALVVSGLTPREREVAEAIAGGLTNAAAAQRLGIGSETVKTHLRSIYSRLGVRTRVGLALRLRAAGEAVGPEHAVPDVASPDTPGGSGGSA